MKLSRRSLLLTGAAALGGFGTLSSVATSAQLLGNESKRRSRYPFYGYGKLVKDPKGMLDLPEGFRYHVFSKENDALTTGGVVPSSHDGMAAFSGENRGTVLVRNHELEPEDIEEDKLTAVAHVAGRVYDPDLKAGGCTTIWVDAYRKLIRDEISLAGTADNCAGGPTPWGTWLSCEETFETFGKKHGYVFEVHPRRGGNSKPILGMGRCAHEAVAFDREGIAYLTEDESGPFGCVYRYVPNQLLGGPGSLHGGGSLAAMAIAGLDTDLSIVQNVGTVLNVSWVDVPNPDPEDDETPVREQVIALGATPVQKAEGMGRGNDGSIWFISSRGDGPDAEDEEDRSAAVHSGQIWKYDPYNETIKLLVLFPKGTPFDEPDNITVGPHGFAVACTDGGDDQWLVGITDEGRVFPFAFNAINDEEFAGAAFSPDGRTLFANIQGPPGLTFAIWGPWRGERDKHWRSS